MNVPCERENFVFCFCWVAFYKCQSDLVNGVVQLFCIFTNLLSTSSVTDRCVDVSNYNCKFVQFSFQGSDVPSYIVFCLRTVFFVVLAFFPEDQLNLPSVATLFTFVARLSPCTQRTLVGLAFCHFVGVMSAVLPIGARQVLGMFTRSHSFTVGSDARLFGSSCQVLRKNPLLCLLHACTLPPLTPGEWELPTHQAIL